MTLENGHHRGHHFFIGPLRSASLAVWKGGLRPVIKVENLHKYFAR
jgi:hypothetical protein